MWMSFDCGEQGAMSKWKKDKVLGVYDWNFTGNILVCQGMMKVVREIKKIVEKKTITAFVVEKPSRRLAYAWIIFRDLRVLARRLGITFVEMHPMTIKKRVTGNGKASKKMIRKAVRRLGLYKDKGNEHIYDAIACGYSYLEG